MTILFSVCLWIDDSSHKQLLTKTKKPRTVKNFARLTICFDSEIFSSLPIVEKSRQYCIMGYMREESCLDHRRWLGRKTSPLPCIQP